MYLSYLNNKQMLFWLILFVLGVNILVLILIPIGNNQIDQLLHQDNILDWCYHIYFDAGSNIGNSIRKFFEIKDIRTKILTLVVVSCLQI